MEPEFPENANTHIVTFPVISNVDPAELLDIIIAVRENIIEMVEQQCIECDILEEEISVEYADKVYGGHQNA